MSKRTIRIFVLIGFGILQFFLHPSWNGKRAEIEIGTFELGKKDIEIKDKKAISTKEFLAHEDWRIELLLAEDDENIQLFKNSNLQKVKLKDIRM